MQALITLTGEGRFTLTNPPTSSRCILVRRGVKVMGEREMKTLAPGDDPCALHVGDVVVLDGNETRPQYTWRFEDDSPKPSPTARAQQAAATALAAAPPASSSSSSSVVPAIQAAVKLSGPENHHPNEPAPTTASPARNKQHKTSSMPPPRAPPSTTQQQQQQAPATDSTLPAPSAPSKGESSSTSSSGAVDRNEQAPPTQPTQASKKQQPPAGDGSKKRPPTTTEPPPPPAPEAKPAAAAPPAARPTSTKSSSKAAEEGSPEKPIRLDLSDDDDEDEHPRSKKKPAPGPPRSPQQQAAAGGGGGSQGSSSSSSAKRGTPTRLICLDLSDYEEEEDHEEEDEVEVVSVTPAFVVGQNVFVTGRTGPGMNKPGGFGRVTAVRETGPGAYCYDVKYVLGGRESQLEARLLHAANYLEDPRPRKRLSSTGRAGGGGGGHEGEANNKRPRTQQAEGGQRPAVEDDDDVVDLAGSDSEDDEEEDQQQGMEVDGDGGEAMEVEGEGRGLDWAELKQQRSGASMDDDGDEEESGGEAMEEEEEAGGSQGEGDVLGLAKHKAKRRRKKAAKKKGRGSSSSGGEYEEDDEEDGEEGGRDRQQVVTVRCTLCAKAFKLRCQADSDKMAVHLRQCQRVAVKREKDRRGLSSSELEVAKEMPSSLSVCLSSNLSVQDPSFLLSAIERWLAVKQQTVSLKFHQDLLATFLDTACPLRARCFRRILERLHSSFPPHRFSSSWRPIDVLEFTRLLQSVDTDGGSHKPGASKQDLRRLRSRALLLDYYTTIFEVGRSATAHTTRQWQTALLATASGS